MKRGIARRRPETEDGLVEDVIWRNKNIEATPAERILIQILKGVQRYSRVMDLGA